MELLVFIGLLSIVLKFRKGNVFSVRILQDLIVYVPPTDEDFEILEKTNTKVKTNMKGETRRFNKNKSNRKAMMPLRTFPISTDML